VPNLSKRPQRDGALVVPNQGGGTNWYSPALNPETGLFYVNANRGFSVYYIYDASDNPMGWGGTDQGGYSEQARLTAIDYRTGKIRWSVPRYGPNSGLLTTAGDLVFGAGSGGLQAYHAGTGESLWHSRIGGITNGPITYELDALQYVVAAAGGRLAAFVLND
jgi:alcohol dehydrogenase (cytochrome c)